MNTTLKKPTDADATTNYTLSHRECGHPRHLCHATFADFDDDFDDNGQLKLMRPSARSIPTARRRRNHLELCKNCMTKVTRMSVHTLDGTEYTTCLRRLCWAWAIALSVKDIDFQSGGCEARAGLSSSRAARQAEPIRASSRAELKVFPSQAWTLKSATHSSRFHGNIAYFEKHSHL